MRRTDWHDLFVRFIRKFDGNPDARSEQEQRWWWDIGGLDFDLVSGAMADVIEATQAKVDLGGTNPQVPSLLKIQAAIHKRREKRPKSESEEIHCIRCLDHGTIALFKIPEGKLAHSEDVLTYNFLVREGVEGFTGEEVGLGASAVYACSCRAGSRWVSGEHFSPIAEYDLSILDDRFHRLWEQYNEVIPTPSDTDAVFSTENWGVKKSNAESKNEPDSSDGPVSPLRSPDEPPSEVGQASEDEGTVEDGGYKEMVDGDIPF